MTTLVTGATGTIGSQIVVRLAEAGHPVRALTRRPTAAVLALAESPRSRTLASADR